MENHIGFSPEKLARNDTANTPSKKSVDFLKYAPSAETIEKFSRNAEFVKIVNQIRAMEKEIRFLNIEPVRKALGNLEITLQDGNKVNLLENLERLSTEVQSISDVSVGVKKYVEENNPDMETGKKLQKASSMVTRYYKTHKFDKVKLAWVEIK
jgi:hypothetical protein